MPQPKSKDWLNGYKNKIPIYAAYKKVKVKSLSHVQLFATPCSTPGFPVHHQLLELTQTHVH